MPEYWVTLRADVIAEWQGEAGSREEAARLALAESKDLPYEVDFDVESVEGGDDDDD